MPKIKTLRTKFPEGWEVVEPFLDELNKEMRVGMTVIHRFVKIFKIF